jgi:hypothetical protein
MRSISLLLSSVRTLFAKVFIASISCLLLCVGFSNLFPIQIAAAATPAYVRVIHASPFIGTADVFVDGQPLLTSFEFAAVTDYVPVPPGTHKIQITLVGKGLNAAVLNQDVTVEEGKVYTVAALGTSAGHLSLQAFEDDNHLDPAHARVRIYQLSPNADNVDISVGEDSNVTDMKYPTASGYVDTDAGPCIFTLTDPHPSLPPLSATLDTQVITSVFIVGMFNQTPQAQLLYKQSPAIPGLPQTGNDPSPLADNVPPLSALSLCLIGWVLILSLMVLRKWLRSGFKMTGTI